MDGMGFLRMGFFGFEEGGRGVRTGGKEEKGKRGRIMRFWDIGIV